MAMGKSVKGGHTKCAKLLLELAAKADSESESGSINYKACLMMGIKSALDNAHAGCLDVILESAAGLKAQVLKAMWKDMNVCMLIERQHPNPLLRVVTEGQTDLAKVSIEMFLHIPFTVLFTGAT